MSRKEGTADPGLQMNVSELEESKTKNNVFFLKKTILQVKLKLKE
jgi:hypothetical protein